MNAKDTKTDVTEKKGLLCWGKVFKHTAIVGGLLLIIAAIMGILMVVVTFFVGMARQAGDIKISQNNPPAVRPPVEKQIRPTRHAIIPPVVPVVEVERAASSAQPVPLCAQPCQQPQPSSNSCGTTTVLVVNNSTPPSRPVVMPTVGNWLPPSPSGYGEYYSSSPRPRRNNNNMSVNIGVYRGRIGGSIGGSIHYDYGNYDGGGYGGYSDGFGGNYIPPPPSGWCRP